MTTNSESIYLFLARTAHLTFTIAWLAILSWNSNAFGAELTKDERLANTHASIYGTGVGSPMGRFLLVRNSKGICAIRFTSFHHGHDAKPATWYRTGDETLYADYDWYFQKSDDGDFSKPDVASGHGEASWGEWRGLGHWLAWGTGHPFVQCGPIGVRAAYPNIIWLVTNDPELKSNGIEASPTGWKNISQVNPNNPELIWYRYNEKQKQTYIPLDQLIPNKKR